MGSSKARDGTKSVKIKKVKYAEIFFLDHITPESFQEKGHAVRKSVPVLIKLD